MTASRTASSRIPQLELLRVLATAGIVLFHVWSVVPLHALAGMWGAIFDRVPFLGAIGVIVFNVITGFVLSVPYLSPHACRPIPPALAFFRQRFGRICLHYYPILVLWTVAALVLPPSTQAGWSLVVPFLAHATFVHTLSSSTFFAIVPAFWWLGMLAQFYLVCPWLLRFYTRVGPGKACVLACVVPWLAWVGLTALANQLPGSLLARVHYLAYFNVPVRLPEFAIGMWLAFAWNSEAPLLRGRPRECGTAAWMPGLLVACLLGIGLFVLLNGAWLDPLPRPYDHIYLVAWSVLSILAMLRWSVAARLGAWRLVLDLAATSYGIYLLHQPLLHYANQLVGQSMSPASRFVVLLLGVGGFCYWASAQLNLLLYRLSHP